MDLLATNVPLSSFRFFCHRINWALIQISANTCFLALWFRSGCDQFCPFLKSYGFVQAYFLPVHQIEFENLGYKIVKGNRLNADDLRAIFQGLLANELLEYDYILTGLLFMHDDI